MPPGVWGGNWLERGTRKLSRMMSLFCILPWKSLCGHMQWSVCGIAHLRSILLYVN